MADPTAPRLLGPEDRGARRTAFSLEESARRVGHFQWIEMRAFEALGGWVATVPEPEVKLLLAVHAPHHAWHAELWHDRLPKLQEMPPERFVGPANDELVAFVAALTEPVAPEQTIEKLVGAYRVLLPHLVAAYEHHRDQCSTVADGPTIRTLGFVLQDDAADVHEGELLLRALLRTPADARRAEDHQAELEGLLRAAGGIAGPGSTEPVDAGPR